MTLQAQTITTHQNPQKSHQPTPLFAQNKPNFKNTKINTRPAKKSLYEISCTLEDRKNKANSNPIKANIFENLGKRLNVPIVNLGFSGHGWMDLEIAELIGEIDASLYIIDCLPNLNIPQVSQRTGPFLKILRKKHLCYWLSVPTTRGIFADQSSRNTLLFNVLNFERFMRI